MVRNRLAQQITNRDNGNRFTLVDHRQMANAVLVHKPQTVGKCVREIDGDDVANHDICDRSCLGDLLASTTRLTQSRSDRTPTVAPRSRTTRKPMFLSAMIRSAASTLSVGPTVHRAQGSAPRIRRSGR